MSILTQKTTKTVGFSSILATFALIFVISLQSSCAKSNACDLKASYTNDANAAQNTAMVAFCTTNNITYSTHPSGILYQIITPGAASKPNLCETISMTYTGTLLNGTKFDAGTISYICYPHLFSQDNYKTKCRATRISLYNFGVNMIKRKLQKLNRIYKYSFHFGFCHFNHHFLA